MRWRWAWLPPELVRAVVAVALVDGAIVAVVD